MLRPPVIEAAPGGQHPGKGARTGAICMKPGQQPTDVAGADVAQRTAIKDLHQGRHVAPVCRNRMGRISTYPGERSEEHTSELQSRENLVCRLLLEKKKTQ